VFKKAAPWQNLARGREESDVHRRSAVRDLCSAVFQKSAATSNREVTMEPMRRRLVWVERPNFQRWTCTECSWVFNPSWPLVGKTIDEMKENFGQQLDEEFASHVCAEHPKTTKNPH
jgi:rubredoxin